MSPPTNNWGKRRTEQLFVEELMSYLGCSVHLYPQLFVEGLMSYLGCSVHLSPQLFVGGLMSYLGQTTGGKDEPNILNKT
jgi:hypothetical protein